MSRIIRIVLVALVATFSACASYDQNPTVAPYQIDREALAKKPIKRVVIASANISGEPTRYFLQKPATRIDARIKRYLEEHGLVVAPSYEFDNAYNQALRTYGNLYDPTSGRVDPTTWRAVMVTAMQALQGSSIDAIIFTDVVEVEVAHSVGLEHLAQWDGVSRKPDFASASSMGVSTSFDWGKQLKAATLIITVFNTDVQGVFSGRGGLDTLQVIDAKATPHTYVRRKKILTVEDNLDEGIALAFHPLVPMEDYPGKEQP